MLSIIIPSYKDPRILRAIESVRRFDDRGDVQLVIIDGGSDEELIERIRGVFTPRDLLIWERDKGIFDALNKGLERATGDLIGWLGSDDIFHDKVKASDVVSALNNAEIFVGGTAMVDLDRVKRIFWLPPRPARAAFFGIHNPHFSTFGRAAVLRRAHFDISSPVADIGYFLDVFATDPSVHVDRRIVTLQQVGGFSNGSICKSIKYNNLTYPLYRAHVSPLRARLASVLKVVPKILSGAFYRLKRTTIQDNLLRA